MGFLKHKERSFVELLLDEINGCFVELIEH